MNGPIAFVLVLATLLAGCAVDSRSTSFGPDLFDPDAFLYEFDGYHWRKAIVTDAQGNVVDVDPEGIDAMPKPVLRLVPRARSGGSLPTWPELVVAPNGTLFAATNDVLTRSLDRAKSWDVVFELQGPAPQHDDVFGSSGTALGLDAAKGELFLWMHHLRNENDPTPFYCMTFGRSGDAGDTWENPASTNWPRSCVEQYGDSGARMLVAPPSPRFGTTMADPLEGDPRDSYVYLCREGTCWTSRDWGESFQRTGSASGCRGGRPAHFGDGSLAIASCDGRLSVALSEDGSHTWTPHAAGPESVGPTADLAVSKQGTLYVAYQDAERNATYLVSSADRLNTWSQPWRISPEGITNVRLPTVVAGDDGRVAVAYLGTRTKLDVLSADSYKDFIGQRVEWHLFLTFPLVPGALDGRFVTLQVTPEEFPSLVGRADAVPPFKRSILPSFFDAELDGDGRLHVLAANSCTTRSDCPGDLDAVQRQTTDVQLALVVQDSGWSFFDARGALDPLGFSMTAPYPPKGVPLR